MLYVSAGVLIGFGLSGCSFNLVITSIAKMVPEGWRSMVFGAGTAAGSFGQFLFSPLAVGLIDAYGWQTALEIFAGLLLLIIPLTLMVAKPRATSGRPRVAAGIVAGADLPAGAGRSLRPPLLRAPGARLLHLRLPARLRHRAPAVLSDRPRALGPGRRLDARRDRAVQHRRRDDLGLARQPHAQALHPVGDLFCRALAVIGLVTLPASPTVALIYGAVTGLLWLSSVPPTSGLVAVMFGTRWLAMLFGFAFFSHQVGGFLGVYLGGVLYERTGSYDIVWWLGVLFGVLSALINLPIVEKPVARLAAAAA